MTVAHDSNVTIEHASTRRAGVQVRREREAGLQPVARPGLGLRTKHAFLAGGSGAGREGQRDAFSESPTS